MLRNQTRIGLGLLIAALFVIVGFLSFSQGWGQMQLPSLPITFWLLYGLYAVAWVFLIIMPTTLDGRDDSLPLYMLLGVTVAIFNLVEIIESGWTQATGRMVFVGTTAAFATIVFAVSWWSRRAKARQTRKVEKGQE